MGGQPGAAGLAVGDQVEVAVGAPAHGGHCVARHAGQVLFVRHALPGEQVIAEVTSLGPKGRFVRADAIEIRTAHPQRVTPACPLARPKGCGGCDWQHASPQLQRELKTAVLHEAMARFAGVDTRAEVVDVGGNPGGLAWRTRADIAVDDAGRAGFRGHRSREVVPVANCPLLVDPAAAGAFGKPWPAGSGVRFVAPAVGPALAFPAGRPPSPTVTETAAGRDWLVGSEGFWQVHPRAGDVLVGAVGAGLAGAAGRRVADLYSGVGLLAAGALGAGSASELVLVESDRVAAGLARRNVPGAAVVRAPVDRWVGQRSNLADVGAAVLDPPRAGAGRAVLAALSAAAGLGRLIYVACDPVALARDTETLLGAGWELADLRAFDLFPSTQHFETLAVFRRST